MLEVPKRRAVRVIDIRCLCLRDCFAMMIRLIKGWIRLLQGMSQFMGCETV